MANQRTGERKGSWDGEEAPDTVSEVLGSRRGGVPRGMDPTIFCLLVCFLSFLFVFAGRIYLFGFGFLQATVTPSNIPSRKLFERFGTHMGAPVSVADLFTSRMFAPITPTGMLLLFFFAIIVTCLVVDKDESLGEQEDLFR
jgi:hypothetical protein